MKLQRIMYAVGNKELEDFLTKNGLDPSYGKVVATVVHRGAIIPKIQELNLNEPGSPLTLILNEGLESKSEGRILDICKEIRVNYPHTRIILVGGEHEIGDEFLCALLSMGIYDVTFGEKVSAVRIIELIHNPNTYADALSFVSKSNVAMDSSLSAVPEAEAEPKVVTRVVVPQEPESKRPLFTRRTPAPKQTEVKEEKQTVSEEKSTVINNNSPEGKERGNSGITENPPVIAVSKPPAKTNNKTVFVYSVTDGYMAREVALSLACLLASAKKVLLVDVSDGGAVLPPRLNIKTDRGLGCLKDINDTGISELPISPYLYKNTSVPPLLYLLSYGEGENMLTDSEIIKASEVIEGLGYDLVLYVCDRASDWLTKAMRERTSRQVLVTDQYSVSVNRTYQAVRRDMLNPSEAALCLTGTVKSVKPRMGDLLSLYGLKYGEELELTTAKLLLADSRAVPYMYGRDRRKLTRLSAFITG